MLPSIYTQYCFEEREHKINSESSNRKAHASFLTKKWLNWK